MATQTVDPQGNVIVNGFSTNLNPTQYVNSNIPVSSISATTPINLPDIKSTDLSSVVPTVQADIAGGLTSATSQVDQATKVADQARTQGISLSNLLAGTEANNVKDVSGTYQAQGVNTLYNQLQDLNAQATGLKNEASAIPIQNAINYQGSAGTQGQVTSVNRDQLSQNALKALSLGQQYAIASGNYEKAKSYADQLIETKYAKEQARIAGLKEQQNALDKYVLTPAENKRLEAVKRKTDLEEKQLQEKKDNEKQISDVALLAAKNGAPSDVINSLKTAKTAIDAFDVASKYMADPLERELKRAQLAKIYSDISIDKSKLKNQVNGLRNLTGTELSKFNQTPQAKTLQNSGSFVGALNAYKKAIETYGTGEVINGIGQGALNGAYQNLTAAVKDYYKLGTLDSGVEKLIEIGIPKPSLMGRKSSRISSIDGTINQVRNEVDSAASQLYDTTYGDAEEAQSIIDSAKNQTNSGQTIKIGDNQYKVGETVVINGHTVKVNWDGTFDIIQ